MAEWKNYTLEEVCERIYSGGTPSTKHEEYWNGDIKWLSSGETSQRFVYDTERKITQEGVENSSTKLATKGCTVVATAGQGYTRGQASFLMTDTYMNQSVIACKANENVILPLYLYYNLDSRYEEFRLLSDGTSTRGGLSGWILKRMEIKLPPKSSQKKIIDILYSIDRKIEENKAINNNLEQQVTTVFYNMFGKYEQNSNTHKPLSTIAKFKYGTMPKKDKLGTGHYHAFSGYQIVGTYPEVMFENPQLIIVARGVGGCGDVKYTPANCYLTNLSIAIITEKTMHDDYLYHYLRLHDTKIMNTGSAQPQITVATLEKFEIPIPPEEEMIRFSDFVQPFKQQYRNNQDENKLLSKLRDTLLPKLMSGELDISDIDL